MIRGNVTLNIEGTVVLEGGDADPYSRKGANSGLVENGSSATKAGNIIIADEGIHVSKFTFGSVLSTSSIQGDITILVGSIKTNQPIRGAKNEESDVYQAILPLWSCNITIDGQSFQWIMPKVMGMIKHIYMSQRVLNL